MAVFGPLTVTEAHNVTIGGGGTSLLYSANGVHCINASGTVKIKTGKLTAQQLQKAMKALLAQMKKQHDRQKIPHGKQTLKQLMKQNAGVSNIEITKDNIKAFESTAKKYGIDFALKKDSTETPPRYLVFFKGRDADALTAAFKEFSAKKLTQEQKPSIRKLIVSLKEKAAALNAQRDKVKNKDRGIAR